MSHLLSDLTTNTRFQFAATALFSGATVAALIFGYQALEKEERLSELKNSIPSLSETGPKVKPAFPPCQLLPLSAASLWLPYSFVAEN